MPFFHVSGMGPKIGARFIKFVIKLQVQMVRLQRHALSELFAMGLSRRPYSGRVLPWTGRFGVKGPSGTELPLAQRLHGRAHVAAMGRAKTLHDPFQAGWVVIRPPLGIVPEPQTRSLWISTGAQHTERIQTVSSNECYLSRCTETGADFVMVLKTGEYFWAMRIISSFCPSETSASILKYTRISW
jgi:hypothetical protein